MSQLNTSMKSVIVHYHEIALKGGNRPWFIARLVRNLRALTADLGVTRVRALMGRIKLELDPTAEWETLAEQLRLVFGVANFAQAGHVLGGDLEKIAGAILADLGDRRLECQRAVLTSGIRSPRRRSSEKLGAGSRK